MNNSKEYVSGWRQKKICNIFEKLSGFEIFVSPKHTRFVISFLTLYTTRCDATQCQLQLKPNKKSPHSINHSNQANNIISLFNLNDIYEMERAKHNKK